ncbi:hypothetical protein ACJMK2_037695 [Sinanodonta woodiana]|uniref:Uncharacterized protein n=1 Tax=Sinanodonta woodiana TaxID=1069815 RepID=A0ABD3WPR4_SINWO
MANATAANVRTRPQGVGLQGHKSRMHLCFDVVIDNGTLLAFHGKGVQLLNFSSNDTEPKLIEVFAALEAQVINISEIAGLQNAGPRKMMLYPVDESKPLLKSETIMVKGLKARIHEPLPLLREQLGRKWSTYLKR